MRKITKLAVAAFLSNQPFCMGNTQVIGEDNCTKLTLHGNTIATLDRKGQLTITNAGWQSNATKERLNGLPNVAIQQIKGKWYLNGNEWNGQPIKIK